MRLCAFSMCMYPYVPFKAVSFTIHVAPRGQTSTLEAQLIQSAGVTISEDFCGDVQYMFLQPREFNCIRSRPSRVTSFRYQFVARLVCVDLVVPKCEFCIIPYVSSRTAPLSRQERVNCRSLSFDGCRLLLCRLLRWAVRSWRRGRQAGLCCALGLSTCRPTYRS